MSKFMVEAFSDEDNKNIIIPSAAVLGEWFISEYDNLAGDTNMWGSDLCTGGAQEAYDSAIRDTYDLYGGTPSNYDKFLHVIRQIYWRGNRYMGNDSGQFCNDTDAREYAYHALQIIAHKVQNGMIFNV